MFPTGDQRALWAQKEADLGPRKTSEGIRLPEEVSRSWGTKASSDLVRPTISFREHSCAYWTTCLARYENQASPSHKDPKAILAATRGPFLCPARIHCSSC